MLRITLTWRRLGSVLTAPLLPGQLTPQVSGAGNEVGLSPHAPKQLMSRLGLSQVSEAWLSGHRSYSFCQPICSLVITFHAMAYEERDTGFHAQDVAHQRLTVSFTCTLQITLGRNGSSMAGSSLMGSSLNTGGLIGPGGLAATAGAAGGELGCLKLVQQPQQGGCIPCVLETSMQCKALHASAFQTTSALPSMCIPCSRHCPRGRHVAGSSITACAACHWLGSSISVIQLPS
jgi:hypothetical protein